MVKLAWWFAPTSERDVLRFRLGRTLRPRQSGVAIAILGDGGEPPSYVDVAQRLGIHVGTVHRHLGRVRRRHPELYAQVMAERKRQLAARHSRVVAGREYRSLLWGRRGYAARYRDEDGAWPWDDVMGWVTRARVLSADDRRPRAARDRDVPGLPRPLQGDRRHRWPPDRTVGWSDG
jgi:transposase